MGPILGGWNEILSVVVVPGRRGVQVAQGAQAAKGLGS